MPALERQIWGEERWRGEEGGREWEICRAIVMGSWRGEERQGRRGLTRREEKTKRWRREAQLRTSEAIAAVKTLK